MLSYNNGKYLLWKNNIIVNTFSNYYDYLKYYHFLQSNYQSKKIYCPPLVVDNSKPKLSNNPMDKNWIGNRAYRYNLQN